MSFSEHVGKSCATDIGGCTMDSVAGGKTPPYIGQIIKYYIEPGKYVPAIIEAIQPNGLVELTYFWKGLTTFAVAGEGIKVYEYQQ